MEAPERRGTGQAAPRTPAEMRAFIVERLVGDTGEPERVLAAARALAEGALPAFAATLNGMLAAKLTVELGAVEIARTAEAKALAEAGQLLAVAGGGGASDTATLALDAGTLALVVCAMFGGDPAAPLGAAAREPSPIEREVAASVLAALALALGDGAAPGGGLALDLPLPEIKTQAEAAKWTPRDGPGARIVLHVRAGANAGTVTLLVLQRVLLGRRAAPGEASPRQDWNSHIGGELMRSTVTVEATMPLARATLGAVAEFAVGQVLALDEGATAGARLFVRGKPLFTGEFGRLGANYTVRVSEPFSEAREFINTLVPAGLGAGR
jgi:flagellar motor switch protein FliM